MSSWTLLHISILQHSFIHSSLNDYSSIQNYLSSPLFSFLFIFIPSHRFPPTNTISTIFLIILHIHKFIHVFTQHTHSLRLIIRSQHQLARCASLTKHKSTEITNTRLMKTVEFFTAQIARVAVDPFLVLVARLLQHGQSRDREDHVLLRVNQGDRSLREDAGWGLHLLRRRFVALYSIRWWFLFHLERMRGFAGPREDDFGHSCAAERAATTQSKKKRQTLIYDAIYEPTVENDPRSPSGSIGIESLRYCCCRLFSVSINKSLCFISFTTRFADSRQLLRISVGLSSFRFIKFISWFSSRIVFSFPWISTWRLRIRKTSRSLASSKSWMRRSLSFISSFAAFNSWRSTSS